MVDPDTIIDKRYRVCRRLGSGGMADVYLAEDQLLGRQVAVKVLHHRFAEDREFVERFRREASSAAGLSHPNVVAVFDRGEWNGTYYIAMEYLPGRSLKTVVREEGRLDPGVAIEIVIQILQAARFAHRRGIIHRDLKPHNVILDAEGRAKVTDFGIARAGASDMTLTGSIMGTAQYLSPEQAQGHSVSGTSDLYSIGIVLYELLTGTVPFDGESAVTIALKQIAVEPPAPSAVNPAVTPALDAVVLRALTKDPGRRFADADEFIAALQQAREGILPGLAPNGPTTQGALFVPPVALGDGDPRPAGARRRRRALWALAGAILAAGVVVVLLLLLPSGSRVTVPNITGETRTVAVARLNRAGLTAALASASSATVSSGVVIGQTPPGGSVVKKGARVSVVVSSGPGSLALADVRGLTSAQAVRELREKGLKPTVQSEPSDTVAAGRVISTRPGAGSEVLLGSSVTVLASSGPTQVRVPDVTGHSQATATTTLTGVGLKVVVSKRDTTARPPGTVLSQSPHGGASLRTGGQVTLVVAQAPSGVPVPDVVGRGEAAAAASLAAAGFSPQTASKTVTDPAQVGIVLEQRPAAGLRARKGAGVTITVGKLGAQTTPTTTTAPPPSTKG